MADTYDLYVIPNWDRDFETSKSKDIARTTFFCVQNNFDGKKIRRLQNLKKPTELYGAFHAIVAIASKCLYRGVLLDHDGPINAQDLAAKTGFPSESFVSALEQLSKPGVGLLEKHEIVSENGIWPLPDCVRTWAVARDSRRTHAGSRGRMRSHADGQNGHPNNGTTVGDADARERTRTHADARENGRIPDAAKDPITVQNSTEQDCPLPSPEGDEEQSRMVGLSEAKQLICKKILGGKNPNRLWGPEAENLLARMVEAGLPEQEIEDIAWFRGLPANDEIPELKSRRFPITETTLMNYWGDEVTRAQAYRRKNHGDGNGRLKKKEPPRWREFFRAQYPETDDLRLPEAFADLAPDLRVQWEKSHEEWELKNPEL